MPNPWYQYNYLDMLILATVGIQKNYVTKRERLVTWRLLIVSAVGDGASIGTEEEGERRHLIRYTIAYLVAIRD